MFRYTSLATFWRYTRGNRAGLLFTLFLFALSAAPLPLVPVYMGRLIEAIATTPRVDADIVLNACIMVGLGAAHGLGWHLSEFAFRRWMLPLQDRYETYLFHDVVGRGYPFFIEKSTGKIAASIGSLHDRLRILIERMYWGYTPEIVSLATLFVVMTTINWQSALILGIGLALIPFLAKHALRRSLETEAELTDIRSTKTGNVIDSVANFVSVKSFRTERRETITINALQQQVIAKHSQNFTWRTVFWLICSLMVRWAIWPAIVAVNLWLLMRGQATVADVTTALTAGLIFTTTIWEIIWYVSDFSMTMASLEESHTYLFGKRVVDLGSLPTSAPRTSAPEKAGVSFTGVSFAYPDKPERAVLHDVSIDIAPGEKVGIVGHSGSGKTTLVKLLLGYYQPDQGTIRGTGFGDVAHETADLCTYVPQDTAMFNRTVAQNIAYAGGDDVSIEDIERAAHLAYAHEFIKDLPDGYDTLVGERGVKLSGGQRQRIAIARAVLNHRPVLVLDEATSALDTDSERHVQDALDNLWTDRTVVAIAHRLSTLQSMDRIVVMDSGRVVESGTHAELMAHDGIYAHLWAQQSGGFITQ